MNWTLKLLLGLVLTLVAFKVLLELLRWTLIWLVAFVERYAPRPVELADSFGPRQCWMLTLAHPMAQARGLNNFAADTPPTPELVAMLRYPLLHMFGLRNDMDDAQIRVALAARLAAHWYTIDLANLRVQDDPRDAMAFACARLAFSVRAAGVLGWLDEATQWDLLAQNARRTQGCFSGWADYATAWARGRQQWVTESRADSLGISFGEQDVKAWLADAEHPWHQLPWSIPPE